MIRNARPPFIAVTRHVSTPLIHVRSESTVHSSPSIASASPSRPRPPKPTKAGIPKHASRRNAFGDDSGKPLLKPYELSGRLTKLCTNGKVDEAFETLKKMPLDAQNVVVWNTMIRNAGFAHHYSLAYQIYIDMKRRGFKPNLRTYGSLMAVYQKISSWTERTKLLQNVHKAYESYLEYLSTVREYNSNSPELSISPINSYLAVLSRAEQWQRMYDVYHSLDSIHLSPDHFTYTVMLYTLGNRSTRQRGEHSQVQAVRERMASEARLIWRQMMKQIDNGLPIKIDAPLIDAAIQSLALGRPADQIIAFDILRDYVGLAKPGETAPPPTVELSPILLSDVLWLCNISKKHRLSVHFVQQLMRTNPDILDCGHMDHVLTAYGYLGVVGSLTESSRALQTIEWMLEQELTRKDGHKLRPTLASYSLALVACWRGKDWESALRIFELMTGYVGEHFADGTVVAEPQPIERSRGRNLVPDAASMSYLVRTAFASGDLAHMRQCARIVRHLGLKCLTPSDATYKEGKRAAPRFQRDAPFYAYKTASALVELVDVLVPKKTNESVPLTEEQQGWVALRREARTFLVEHRDTRPRVTPQVEEQLLGSEQGLAATDDAVTWDRISREQKSTRRTIH